MTTRLKLACLTLMLILNPSVVAQGTDAELEQALSRYETGASRFITEWQIQKQLKVRLGSTSKEFPSLHGSGKVQQWQGGFLLSLKHTPAMFALPQISNKVMPSYRSREEEWVVLKRTPTAIIGGVKVSSRVREATAQRLYGSGHGLNSALCTAVLLGMNPLRLLEKGYTFQREGKLVRVKGRFLPDVLVQQRVPEAEIVLDVAKGYAPVRMTASTADYTEEVQVLEWKQVGGMWIPQDVESTDQVRSGTSNTTARTRCRLIAVKRASPQPPAWLTEDLLIEDHRWGLPGVTYRLKEGIPTIEELKRMRQQQSGPQRSRAGEVGWLKFGAPLLLIAVGIIWYRRLGRTESGR
ncbi:MAG: hypothetical protein HPY54_14675 [Chthonomonadetes bacterium]|nr:hypothetical protein [Chthonomonadetes bacterium]